MEDHRGKEPVGKQSAGGGGGGGEREPGRKKGGLAVRVSLMKHSWRREPTALSWQASPHQPVDIIIQPVQGPHTHSWPAALHCTASMCVCVCVCVISDSKARTRWNTCTKCLFMLLQSGIHTSPSHTLLFLHGLCSLAVGSASFGLKSHQQQPHDSGAVLGVCASLQARLFHLKLGVALQKETFRYYLGCQVCSPPIRSVLFSKLPPSVF